MNVLRIWLLCCTCLLLETHLPAQSSSGGNLSYSETDLKAGFVLKFPQYLVWPEKKFSSPTSPIVIGVFGDQPIYDSLVSLINLQDQKGGAGADRPVIIRRVSSGKEAQSVQILWLASSKKDELADILRDLTGSNVLTIAGFDGFVREGGMIELFQKGQNIRFRVNNSAAQAEQIHITSQVLRFAESVR